MDCVDKLLVSGAMAYPAYRKLINELLEHGRTTGNNHSAAMLEYTRMNVRRMDRIDRKLELQPETLQGLQQIDQPMCWLVLTEAWCGDAAHALPVLQRMAQAHGQTDLRLLLRDEHPALMEQFLTAGTRSIPKLIILDPESCEILGSWGPRPEAAMEIIRQAKAERDAAADPERAKAVWSQANVDLQKWYARDRTVSTQREVLAAVQEGVAVSG